MHIRIIVGLMLFSIAMPAHAESIMPWIFRGGMAKEATIQGLTTAEIHPDGLHIVTQSDGFILWDNHPLSGPAEVITVRAQSNKPTDGVIMWKPTNAGGEGLLQLYFKIPATDVPTNVDVVVSGYSQWDWTTQQFAIGFPAGSNVIIEEIQFRHWPWDEKLGLMWKSFWTFDEFRAYSINFLWGPLLATNTPALNTLFDTLPPPSLSATRAFYLLLCIAAVITLGIRFIKKNSALAFGIFSATFVALWLIFDLRMGLEIMKYASDDIQTYATKEGVAQTFRTHDNLYRRFYESLPIIKEHGKFVLLEPKASVYYANLRYIAYPNQLIRENDATSDVRVWAAFERSDVGIDEHSRLWKKADNPEGKITLTGPGKIIKRFDGNSFIFVTDQ